VNRTSYAGTARYRCLWHDGCEPMALEIVGREEEFDSIRAFITGSEAGEGPAVLVLEGEPGIGKSTLWLSGVEHARERGLRVLIARPAEAECDLAHAGLGDLFEGVLDDVLPRLSAPRRSAIEAALLVQEAPPDAVDPRALAIAVRDALHVLAEQSRLLVAIDDFQWLDVASASALAFAWRRLDPSPVLLLLARRSAEGAQPSELEHALSEGRVRRLSLGPLSVGALHALLRDRSSRVFARQTLLRIHEHSGGNPFFALELAGALGSDVDPTKPLPVPSTLEEIVRARLARLPATTRSALVLVAALGAPPESLLARAGVDPQVLDAAFEEHVIERRNGALQFTHPLLSSVLYAQEVDRRSVHRRIADVVDDPLVRVRHLALATEAEDGEIASLLDEAVRTASKRGAAAVAAELAEQAVRLTAREAVQDRHRRALAAARAHRAAGEWTRAKAIAGELLAGSDVGPPRAEALLVLAELEGLDRSITLLEEALHEASSRRALQAVIRCRLAWATRFKQGYDAAIEHARAALELADELDDDCLRIDALLMLTFLGSALGDPEATAHAARACELARGTDEARLSDATSMLAGVLEPTDSDKARALLEGEYQAWHERDELRTAGILWTLSWVELQAGRWQLAAEYADRAYEIKIQYGLEAPWDHLPIAMIAAHRGQLDLARAHSERALRLGEEQIGLHTPVHLGTMGVVALESGDPRTAADWFAEAEAETTRLGWRAADRRWWTGDHVEALLELGRVVDAVGILEMWEEDARRVGSDAVLAHVTRCWGLVAAARGDVAAAASLLEDAIAQHELVGDRFGRARALLALGVVRRRQRQKRATRNAIGAALSEFEQLGAATWLEKARAELGRIGGRTRIEGLTPAESRVARLVAEGRTNREVAAALFLGEKTVETHLTHVYAKLAVRSRAELARVYRADSEDAEQSSGGPAISS
jgi:DNA-binding CsgD family transcriptional regulator